MVSRKAGIFKDNWGTTGDQCWDGMLFISEDLQSSADYSWRDSSGSSMGGHEWIIGIYSVCSHCKFFWELCYINILQNILKRFATNPPKEINIMDMYFSARMHLSYSCPSKRKSIKSPLTNRRSIWYNLYTLIREPQLNI